MGSALASSAASLPPTTTPSLVSGAVASGAPAAASGVFSGYRPPPGTFDEYLGLGSAPRPELAAACAAFGAMDAHRLDSLQRRADGAFLAGGVTFSVYSDQRGTEKVFPFDLLPRVITAAEWRHLERGLRQRVVAINLFLNDIYGPQHILNDRTMPRALVWSSRGYHERLHGLRPPHGVYTHVSGIDLVRDGDGNFVVLEDNVRCPSGVSYLLENRGALQRVLPGLFQQHRVRSVDAWPDRLRMTLDRTAPAGEAPGSTSRVSEPSRAVVLTPGPYNSAYFEHSFLARTMGIPLVQGTDLFVDDDRVWLRTTRGVSQVHTVYRRIDDDFLDPRWGRPDSLLGVPGIMQAWARGNVTLANAPVTPGLLRTSDR